MRILLGGVFLLSALISFSAKAQTTSTIMQEAERRANQICISRMGRQNTRFCRAFNQCVWIRMEIEYPTVQSIRQAGRTRFNQSSQVHAKRCFGIHKSKLRRTGRTI